MFLLLYVESIGCQGMMFDKTLTPIEYWDKNKLKRRETLDIKGGGFGRGKYRRFLKNTKSAVEEPDDNVEQFVLSESIAEMGSLIDSVVKSKSKIEKKLTAVYDNAPENEDVLSIGTNAETQIRDVMSGLANELNVHDMENEDRYSSESDDMDTMDEGNCGGNVDEIRDANKGHNEGAEILHASGRDTMLVQELSKDKTCQNMEEVADKTGAGQEKGGDKTIKKGSGSVGEITSLKLCPSHNGFKDKYGQADKQGHSEARNKLSRPVAQTNVRKDKSHDVAMKLQINERVESDGAGNDTENREGGVNEMQKGTTAIDDIPSFSLGVSQIEVDKSGSLSTDKCESLGVEFGVNEGVQADVTVRITHDTNNLLKEPRSHEKGSNDVDDCPNFSLGLCQVEKKTIVADSGAKSGNEERACRFQFIPAYMLEKDHNKKVSEQTSNVNETTKKEAKGNKGKNVIGLCETEMLDNVTDCELPTFDLGLTPSEDKTLKETSEGDHFGLEAAKLKCRLLAEETARKRDICISLMEKARRNPFTEKTVRRVDIASNVTKEEDDVWKFIFNNQGVDAADGNQSLKGK